MSVNRMAYIVYFKGNQVLNKAEKMNINLVYNSNKMNYLVFFGEKYLERNYLNEFKKIKGFLKLETSSLYNENTNFSLTALENDKVADDSLNVKEIKNFDDLE